MLLYPPIKELLSQVPSRYMLVNLVASRARKLSSEAEVAAGGKGGVPGHPRGGRRDPHGGGCAGV